MLFFPVFPFIILFSFRLFFHSVRIFVGKTKQPWQQNEKEHQILFSFLSSLVFMGIDVGVVYFTILSKSRHGSFLADKTEERKQSKTCEKISPSDLVGPWPMTNKNAHRFPLRVLLFEQRKNRIECVCESVETLFYQFLDKWMIVARMDKKKRKVNKWIQRNWKSIKFDNNNTKKLPP